jgi:acyl-CoA reductase-like NAD-dependent aldehyde dehydrogenase
MATPRGAALVRRQVEEALRAGARARADSHDGEGNYVPAQVLTEVSHSMAVMREETFGPVAGVMKVADDEEALRLMNDSGYGLTASIWTGDLEEGEALAMRVEAGTVLINRCDYLDPFLAWTGVKDSGRGASLGRYGFDSVTRPKSLHLRSA